MYAGATLCDTECLEEPTRDDIPPIGGVPAADPEPEPEPEPAPRKKSRLMSSFTRRIASMFGGEPTDDSELIE